MSGCAPRPDAAAAEALGHAFRQLLRVRPLPNFAGIVYM
jgi:hypothetical protein